MTQVNRENEWQPVRLASVEEIAKYHFKVSDNDSVGAGEIILVRPLIRDREPDEWCPGGRSFEIHPEYCQWHHMRLICEHGILAD
jgi:hypothetical protein